MPTIDINHRHHHHHHCKCEPDNIYRQGETIGIEVEIEIDIEGYGADDFSVMLINPKGVGEDMDFQMEGNVFRMVIQGTETEGMMEGTYRLVVWYHRGGENQAFLEFRSAFILTKGVF